MSDYPLIERNPVSVALVECIEGLRFAQPLIATPPEREWLEEIATRAERVLVNIAETRPAQDVPMIAAGPHTP